MFIPGSFTAQWEKSSMIVFTRPWVMIRLGHGPLTEATVSMAAPAAPGRPPPGAVLAQTQL